MKNYFNDYISRNSKILNYGVGLFFSFPVKNQRIEEDKFKLNHRWRGFYKDDVIKGKINVYSSGFQRDTYERVKHISELKNHNQKIWKDEKGNYIDVNICDLKRMLYVNNDNVDFIGYFTKKKHVSWFFPFSPRKNYKFFIKNLQKKRKIVFSYSKIFIFFK